MHDPEPDPDLGESIPRDESPETTPDIGHIRERLRERSRSIRERQGPDPTRLWRLWIGAAVLLALIGPLAADVFTPILLGGHDRPSSGDWIGSPVSHAPADALWLCYLALGTLAGIVSPRSPGRRPLFSTLTGYAYFAMGLALGTWFGRVMDFCLFLASLGLAAMVERAARTPGRVGSSMILQPPGWARIAVFILVMLAPPLAILQLDDETGLVAWALAVGVLAQAGLLLGFLWMDDDLRGLGLIAVGSLGAGAFTGFATVGPSGLILGVLASPLYFMGILLSAMTGFAIRRGFSSAP